MNLLSRMVSAKRFTRLLQLPISITLLIQDTRLLLRLGHVDVRLETRTGLRKRRTGKRFFFLSFFFRLQLGGNFCTDFFFPLASTCAGYNN